MLDPRMPVTGEQRQPDAQVTSGRSGPQTCPAGTQCWPALDDAYQSIVIEKS